MNPSIPTRALSTDRLAELAAIVLERTAFISSEPAGDSDAAETDRCARIGYTGPHDGCVTLHTTDVFLGGLAANLLGIEPDDPGIGAHRDDALRELANMIGGSVLAELGGESCTFIIGLPELIGSDGSRRDADGCTCRLDCEGQPLVITWSPHHVAAAKAA